MSDLHKIKIDNVTFELKEKHNFLWVRDLGEVFAVFDQQDSGNICFGVVKDGMKRFVKYAGARTQNFSGEPTDAVNTLKQSVDLYTDLKHTSLVNLLDHFSLDGGYVSVFEWFNGESLHPHWSFPPPQKYSHPDSPYYRFKQLPINRRLECLKSIFEFHVHVEQQSYVAIDFYDGSILYDFKIHKTMICDIDMYEKKPFINEMGRLWGSKRFMSPEEFELGAEIDSRTNVFNMGATAFCLLGGELNRSFERWDASEDLYNVAKKAVNENRNNRYSTIKEFYDSWKMVLNK